LNRRWMLHVRPVELGVLWCYMYFTYLYLELFNSTFMIYILCWAALRRGWNASMPLPAFLKPVHIQTEQFTAEQFGARSSATTCPHLLRVRVWWFVCSGLHGDPSQHAASPAPLGTWHSSLTPSTVSVYQTPAGWHSTQYIESVTTQSVQWMPTSPRPGQ